MDYLNVKWLQLRLRDISAEAAGAGVALPPVYWRFFRWWVGLGCVAFLAFLAIFCLMVAKRLPFSS